MIKHMLTSALFAGFAAGLLAALLHFAFVQNLILLGEDYESGTLLHYKGLAKPVAQDHSGMVMAPDDPAMAATDPAAAALPASAAPATAQADDTFSRNSWTVLFFSATYAGYGLILVAGFALVTVMGKTITLREGLLWGIAGFVVIQLAPAMGMEPKLPGTAAADLGQRQMWWIFTVLSSGVAVLLLAYAKGVLPIVAALILLAAPHVVGAPQLDGYSGVAPPEVAAMFATRVLGVGFIVWAAMGAMAGWLWSRPQ